MNIVVTIKIIELDSRILFGILQQIATSGASGIIFKFTLHAGIMIK